MQEGKSVLAPNLFAVNHGTLRNSVRDAQRLAGRRLPLVAPLPGREEGKCVLAPNLLTHGGSNDQGRHVCTGTGLSGRSGNASFGERRTAGRLDRFGGGTSVQKSVQQQQQQQQQQ